MRYSHGGDIYTYQNVLDFSVNINPFGPGEAVLGAVREAVPDMVHYPDSACRELRELLSRKKELPQTYFCFGNGAAELLYLLAQAERPRIALLPVPAFTEYERALRSVGCEIRYVYLKKERGFDLPEDFLDQVTEDVDMIFLSSPSNPAGRVTDPGFLERLALKCDKMHTRLLVDECFIDFTCPAAGSMEQHTEAHPMLFVLQAFTKIFGMPGLRLGYGICSDLALLHRMGEMCQPWNISVPAQAAGIAALRQGFSAEKTARYVRRERIWMEDKLEELKIEYISSEANYILLYSLQRDLFSSLLERNILIRDCRDYRGLGEGYYRVAVKRHGENEKLLRALEEICRQKKGGDA